MNIFKKISLANKLLKAVEAVKTYNAVNHLTDDTKNDIATIKNAVERIANRIPAYRGLVELLKEVLWLRFNYTEILI